MEIEIALSMVIEHSSVTGVCRSRDYRRDSLEHFSCSTYCCRKRTENVGSNRSLYDFKPVIPGPLIQQSMMDYIHIGYDVGKTTEGVCDPARSLPIRNLVLK